MIIAHQKKDENIIEYLLYMWQVEDLARAYNLDMDEIEKNVITQYKQPEEVMSQIREWWENLIAMMKTEKKEKSGHLQVLENTLNDVNRLHLQLLSDPSEVAYKHTYNSIANLIKDFDNKSDNKFSNDIEAMLTAIYTTFLLKLQGKDVSEGTKDAVQRFSKLLAMLAKKYKEELEMKE
jgi:hypothetical protein